MDELADDPIRRRMMALSDAELERVVSVDVGDWTPEAIVAARQELDRRKVGGMAPFREPASPRPGPPEPLADRRRPSAARGAPILLLVVIVIRVLWYLAGP